jgi:hypothetical protein
VHQAARDGGEMDVPGESGRPGRLIRQPQWTEAAGLADLSKEVWFSKGVT